MTLWIRRFLLRSKTLSLFFILQTSMVRANNNNNNNGRAFGLHARRGGGGGNGGGGAVDGGDVEHKVNVRGEDIHAVFHWAVFEPLGVFLVAHGGGWGSGVEERWRVVAAL